MPCEVRWLYENSVVQIELSGYITATDLREAALIALDVLRKHPAHFLIDFSQVQQMTLDALLYPIISEWIYHPNARWFVYIKVAPLYRSLIRVRHRDSIRLFETRSEAEAFLERAVGCNLEQRRKQPM